MFLDSEAFRQVVASTPLVSIDLVVRNTKGELLLGKRLNRPAQGYWFVPGGRVLKDESLDAAFQRLAEVELGCQLQRKSARLLGVYEHFYDDSVFGDDPSTHYVALAYCVCTDLDLGQLPTPQHGEYRWFSVAEMEHDEQIHEHSRAYLPALRLIGSQGDV